MKIISTSKRKHFILLVISFVCSILIFLSIMLLCFRVIVFSPNILNKTLSKTSYSDKIKIKIKDDISYLSGSSGIPVEVYYKIIDEADVYNDVKNSFAYAIKGNIYNIDTRIIENAAKQNIKNYLSSNGIQVSDELNVKIDDIAIICTKKYTDNVQFKLISTVFKLLIKIKTPLSAVIVGIIMLIWAMFFIIYYFNTWKHRAYRYFIYSITGGAGMGLIFSGLVLFTKMPSKIGITSQALHDLISSILNAYFVSVLILSVVVILISISILIPLKIITKKKYS